MGNTQIVRIGVGTVLGVCLLAASVAHAVTPISQSYLADTALTEGTIVSLKENSTDEVEPSNSKNVDNIFGIVVNADNSLITISTKDATQVQVATDGTQSVLVSDINGAIKRGDHLTASPINGVAMKATGNVRIVGIAQGSMRNQKKESIKGADGKKEDIMLGEVPALVNVAYFFKEPDKTIIPVGIQNVANALAGREVSTLPILVSAGIFVVMLAVVSSIVYSMIRSSIISVGRNPMSQSAVYRDLIQMSALVLAILTVGVVAIYLVLTRL
ncbi:TPA: hypothetical protein DIV49_01325 [Candidatus Saccharibacteria bacterium]|nr:hypothetical protein [Candidatus Saccharibacteria bacterium]HRJ90908.1 hypothetical protein [Candidatus Saccharibacteria bacterium]